MRNPVSIHRTITNTARLTLMPSTGLWQPCLIGTWLAACAVVQAAEWKFDFGTRPAQTGFTHVPPEMKYDPQKRFGFTTEDLASQAQSKVFAADLEEGNYDVTIRFGNPVRPTSTTIKAESRRLMIENVETKTGEYETRTFTVNVRQPPITSGGSTSLNSRETGPPMSPHWDRFLTLEFNGPQPGVAALWIRPAPAATTVFVAGDSTVTDQPNEPWAGWGQMLPRFFSQGIAVSNHAESGLALYSFERQKRLDKILNMMKKGDYMFIQFGHNDQKDKTAGAGPFTTYKANLKKFVEAARSKGGIPVLVTPMERRRWKGNEPEATLKEYAEAVRQVATEENAPVIDLNAMSLNLYAALGPENSKKAFVFYPANTFSGQDKELKDNTHHNTYGGYELARCVIEGIKANVPELVKHLAKDAGTYDPAKPDAPEKLEIPRSPVKGATEAPAGS